MRGLELHSTWWCHLLWTDTVTPTFPQGSGTGPVPCSVLGIALDPCLERCALAVAGPDPQHPEATDLPWCHTSGLSLRLLWSLNFVLGACPYPLPQLAPASQHQARLNPYSLGHNSPPYLKVITKDGGAPCAFPKPCCCPGGSCSPSALLLSTPAASPRARQGSPSPHPPLFKALLAWG